MDQVINSKTIYADSTDTAGYTEQMFALTYLLGFDFKQGKKGFLDFLEEVKEMCIRSYENQEYPFEELVKAVNINRDMARTPLFDVMLVVQNNEEVRYEFKEIEIEYINTGNKISKCDLTFNIYEYDELAVELEYCTALYRE